MKWETPVMAGLDLVGPCHCTRPINYEVECKFKPDDGYCPRSYDT